jgi:hypothetical protein
MIFARVVPGFLLSSARTNQRRKSRRKSQTISLAYLVSPLGAGLPRNFNGLRLQIVLSGRLEPKGFFRQVTNTPAVSPESLAPPSADSSVLDPAEIVRLMSDPAWQLRSPIASVRTHKIGRPCSSNSKKRSWRCAPSIALNIQRVGPSAEGKRWDASL